MTQLQDIFDYLKQNKKRLSEEFHVTQIGVFGSFARGDQTSQSDIDLLIELEENTDDIYRVKQSLRKWLGQHFKRDIDIARKKYLKPFVKDHILREVKYVR